MNTNRLIGQSVLFQSIHQICGRRICTIPSNKSVNFNDVNQFEVTSSVFHRPVTLFLHKLSQSTKALHQRFTKPHFPPPLSLPIKLNLTTTARISMYIALYTCIVVYTFMHLLFLRIGFVKGKRGGEVSSHGR